MFVCCKVVPRSRVSTLQFAGISSEAHPTVAGLVMVTEAQSTAVPRAAVSADVRSSASVSRSKATSEITVWPTPWMLNEYVIEVWSFEETVTVEERVPTTVGWKAIWNVVQVLAATVDGALMRLKSAVLPSATELMLNGCESGLQNS